MLSQIVVPYLMCWSCSEAIHTGTCICTCTTHLLHPLILACPTVLLQVTDEELDEFAKRKEEEERKAAGGGGLGGFAGGGGGGGAGAAAGGAAGARKPAARAGAAAAAGAAKEGGAKEGGAGSQAASAEDALAKMMSSVPQSELEKQLQAYHKKKVCFLFLCDICVHRVVCMCACPVHTSSPLSKSDAALCISSSPHPRLPDCFLPWLQLWSLLLA